MKRTLLLAFLLFLFPLGALAQVHELRPGLTVVIPELSEPWIATREAPPSMVEHIAEHLQTDAAAKGRTITLEQAMPLARQRLAANELVIFNQKTEAHLLISFSPIEKGERKPSRKTVARSAQIAAGGVTDEGWSDVADRHATARVKGAQHAQYFEISYKEEGEPQLFMGIVGFADPYWFWLYANDHLKNPEDRPVLERILREIEIRVER